MMSNTFTIIIDTAEQFPFTFTNIISDADKSYTPFIPNIIHKSLGRHPLSLGDYSVVGGEGRCHVERKSMEDAHSTILGFADNHRQRFEQELANLSAIQSAAVVVECSLPDLIKYAPSYGKKTAQQNAKILFRSILAFQQDYKVPWMFHDGRAMAEHATFWFLHRFWEKEIKTKADGTKPKIRKKLTSEVSPITKPNILDQVF